MLPLVLAVALLGTGAVRADSTEDAQNRTEPSSFAEEYRLAQPLAAQGNAMAQFNLGILLDTGRGVSQDYAQAASWYRQAAVQGHTGAQFNLAGMYFEGQGVAQDYVRAYLWFALAGVAGVPGAATNRNIVARLMTPAQITQAQQMTLDCQRRNFRDCD